MNITGLAALVTGGGSGLGLTIAHMIAQVHGATLQFDNRPQGGVRLSILLPQ